MDNREKFFEMLRIQDEANSYLADGKDWRHNNNNWNRAIWIEAAELMEHYGGWKWWKSSPEPDLNQCFLECVDIWHFILSDILQDHSDTFIESHMEFWVKNIDEKYDVIDCISVQDNIEEIAENAISPHTHGVDGMLFSFFELICRLGYTFDDLYKWYIGKNVLNRFRYDHGYKEGTYKKKWWVDSVTQIEDNQYLEYIFKEHVTGDEENLQEKIYENLKVGYNISLVSFGG